MKCSDVYTLFFHPGEVTEIRMFGINGKSKAWEGWSRGTVFGYFDNATAFGAAADALEKQAPKGIYFVPNPCISDCMARAANKLIAWEDKMKTASDEDILCIRWLLIDVDAKYPHKMGISASDEELKTTLKVRNDIYKWLLKEFGVSSCIPACSGNGAHLVYKLPDLPNDDNSKNFVKACLAALNDKFNNDDIDIDLSCFNPARIWKLYGTTARKGDQYKDRVHRKSYIEPKFLKDKNQRDSSGGVDAEASGA
jgi:hypothetical protein